MLHTGVGVGVGNGTGLDDGESVAEVSFIVRVVGAGVAGFVLLLVMLLLLLLLLLLMLLVPSSTGIPEDSASQT